MLKEKYVNVFTDFGFKKLFGTEVSKDVLMDFLNELLKGKEKIKNLQYNPTEFVEFTKFVSNDFIDVYCENEKGDKFIVEIQKAKHNYFRNTSYLLSTFPLLKQAQRGELDFEFKSIYTISIHDFIFFKDSAFKDKVVFEVELSELENNEVFNDKLTFIYLTLPNFRKTESELETRFDKWLYAIKNVSNLDNRSIALEDKIFQKFFESAEIAKLTRDEYEAYEYSLKIYRDLSNVINTAREDGYRKGIELSKAKSFEINKEKGREIGIEIGKLEAKIEFSRNLLSLGVDLDMISQGTGLSLEEIRNI